jgi:hypothetical protein
MSSPLPRSLQGDASLRLPRIYSTFTSFFDSNSNYGLTQTGPRGLFLKAAIQPRRDCFILLNGSVALKSVMDSPKGETPL